MTANPWSPESVRRLHSERISSLICKKKHRCTGEANHHTHGIQKCECVCVCMRVSGEREIEREGGGGGEGERVVH